MTRFASPLLALGLLAGCTASQIDTASTDATTAADDVATTAKAVSTICAAPQTTALLQAVLLQPNVAAQPNTAAGSLLATATAACTASGQVASTLVPNLNASTPAWLTSVLQGLAAAAQVAPYIVPLL